MKKLLIKLEKGNRVKAIQDIWQKRNSAGFMTWITKGEQGVVIDTETERAKVKWVKHREPPEWTNIEYLKLIGKDIHCNECNKLLTHAKEGKDYIKVKGGGVLCANCGGLTPIHYTFTCDICTKRFKVVVGQGHKGNLNRFAKHNITKTDIEGWRDGFGSPCCLKCLKLKKGFTVNIKDLHNSLSPRDILRNKKIPKKAIR